MKIFIAGCGRSGTTLIQDLMMCFDDTYVLKEGEYGEASFSKFDEISRPESHHVIKRLGDSWRTLPDLPEAVDLIYCVRHPLDVLTSTHPLTKHIRKYHITYERWVSEHHAFLALRKKQPQREIFILKYEEIISHPNQVQEKLGKHFGLITKYPFTNNPLGIDIFSSSLEKWGKNPELFSDLKRIPHRYRLLINDFCNEFDYDLPIGYAQGYAETNVDLAVLNIDNPNDVEVLDGQQFFWLGDSQTILDIYSAYNQNVRIMFEAKMGYSYSEQTRRHLRIDSKDWNLVIVVQPGFVEIEVPVLKGENQVFFDVIEKPNIPVLPNGDKRSLMLGILNMRIVN